MGFMGRFWKSFTGQDKSRLPDELAILGAPAELVDKARRLQDVEQEQLFAEFVIGHHGCALDWRATGSDVHGELLPLLTEAEKRALPPIDALPDDGTEAVAAIRVALAALPRALVQTESLGDFSFVILVPHDQEQRFLRCVGPWLITPAE